MKVLMGCFVWMEVNMVVVVVDALFFGWFGLF
jgi:hypothetical protein